MLPLFGAPIYIYVLVSVVVLLVCLYFNFDFFLSALCKRVIFIFYFFNCSLVQLSNLKQDDHEPKLFHSFCDNLSTGHIGMMLLPTKGPCNFLI